MEEKKSFKFLRISDLKTSEYFEWRLSSVCSWGTAVNTCLKCNCLYSYWPREPRRWALRQSRRVPSVSSDTFTLYIRIIIRHILPLFFSPYSKCSPFHRQHPSTLPWFGVFSFNLSCKAKSLEYWNVYLLALLSSLLWLNWRYFCNHTNNQYTCWFRSHGANV